MSYRLLQLSDMLITDFKFQKNQCDLTFSDASIIKVMDAAKQRTSWRQSGCIIVKGNFNDYLADAKMEFPSKVLGGEFQDNVFCYYDTVRLPCHVHGNVGVSLIFEKLSQPLKINGVEMEVILKGNPKYIAHIS